ncbi:unnamed protein product [Protopolystoma xenopodis]|uniref:Uncharacterized protein n=1 Tax=Protopolystoma xenopodis TaxID=117903 RepID=A0A3S5APE8_9PLAT|nr:unnamed protein product [Protopolystoma xenopodis]
MYVCISPSGLAIFTAILQSTHGHNMLQLPDGHNNAVAKKHQRRARMQRLWPVFQAAQRQEGPLEFCVSLVESTKSILPYKGDSDYVSLANMRCQLCAMASSLRHVWPSQPGRWLYLDADMSYVSIMLTTVYMWNFCDGPLLLDGRKGG